MSFTYNGINCESLGMFVEKFPNRPFPTKKVTTYNILGRNGDLIVEHGGYNNVIQEYEVYVNGSGSGLQANLTAIAQWLLYSASGYTNLTDTYDPSIYREARVVGGEEFINALNRFGKATLQFDCKPQRYPIVPEVIIESLSAGVTKSVTIPNSGGMPGYPLVHFEIDPFTPSATIGSQITDGLIFRVGVGGLLSTASVYMDFENRTVYSGDSNDQLTIRLMGDNQNYVEDGTVMSFFSTQDATVTIYPRRWFL